VNRFVWPYSLFCTVLPITEIDGYRIIPSATPGGRWKIALYVAAAGSMSLLGLSASFLAQAKQAAALSCAGACAAALLAMAVIAFRATRCTHCRRLRRRYKRPNFHHQGCDYRLTGWKCESCKEVDIDYCVNRALEWKR
jgi:hypothetical protein